ncbi:hypothetical protein ACJA3S_19330 [Pseudomonas sp. KnCO4]|uniref:hypothetical protein n=1 Tax=Pseudomonas sp. KnCO4 TaxID=3381355 RepID=UPI003877F9B8
MHGYLSFLVILKWRRGKVQQHSAAFSSIQHMAVVTLQGLHIVRKDKIWGHEDIISL